MASLGWFWPRRALVASTTAVSSYQKWLIGQIAYEGDIASYLEGKGAAKLCITTIDAIADTLTIHRKHRSTRRRTVAH